MNKRALIRRLGTCDAGQSFLTLYQGRKPQERALVITAVGGGGKTTLLKHLFHLYRAAGLRVALTTSCKMIWQKEFVSDPEVIRRQVAQGVYIGVRADESHVQGLEADALKALLPLFDVVLIEGDGAKRLPVKVPLSHEPVIHDFSDLTLIVAGLSALGHPLKDKCFRLEEAVRLLQADEDTPITPAVLSRLIRLGYLDNPALARHMGGKAMVLLNQCGSLDRLNAYLSIRKSLTVPVLATNDRHHGSNGEQAILTRWWLG